MKHFIINKNDANQRLDRYISKVCKNLPLSLLQKGLRKGRAKVNKKKQPGDYRLIEGDIVELYLNDEFFEETVKNNPIVNLKPNLNIIYDDNNIIIVDKSAGMLVHSDDKEDTDTLINHILAYLIQKGEYDPEQEVSFRPALCQRIDRNTSGLVIAAKNAEALRDMNRIIKERSLKKLYLCAVIGVPNPKEATLSAYLKRDLAQAKVFVTKEPQEGSLLITTGYRVLKERDGLSLLEVELITGRTHQIRAHMAFVGHPLAGDNKYGDGKINKQLGLIHQELCAYQIQFKDGFEDTILHYLTNKQFNSKQKLKLF